MKSTLKRTLMSATVMSAFLLTGMPPALAEEHNVYPGCEDFPVRLDIEPLVREEKSLPAKNGLPRSIVAGKGYVLTFTNDQNDKSITVKTGGSVQHITYNADRTVQTIKGTGHNAIILFPNDASEVVPVPSTRVYKGRVDYTFVVDSGFTTLMDIRGSALDICAELA